MRILYLHQYFNTPDMPGSTRSYELAKRLVNNDHKIYLVTTKRDKYQDKQIGWTNETGIQVCWIPITYSNQMGFFKRMYSFLLFSFKALKVCLKMNVDVVFATSTPLTIAIPAIIHSKIRQIPMIFEVRDLWPEIPIAMGVLKSKFFIKMAHWLENLAYQNSKRIIALSNGIQSGISQSGYPINQISVITNLSNMEKFNINGMFGNMDLNGLEWDENTPTVIYTGAFGHVNDVHYLVKTAEVMKKLNPRVKFIIAGEGIKGTNIREFAQKVGVLNKSLFVMDPLVKSEVPKLYARASIVTSLFINLKELWNNSANKFFDGLAAGKPIMINYSGWQRELLEKHKAGFYVPHDKPEEGAIKLNQILNDPSQLEFMGKSARQLAEEKFSIDAQYPRFEKELLFALD